MARNSFNLIILWNGCVLCFLMLALLSGRASAREVSYDYKGCTITIEGPLVNFGSSGAESVSAVVRTFGANCPPSWIRLRHERRWWPDRNLITVNNSGGNRTLSARYQCRRGAGMRVFAESKVLGKKFRSRPKKGISVQLCR